MGWTIAHLKGLPDCNIEEPVEGEVVIAKDPETRNLEYGPSQWFVLKDETGDIGVSFSPPNKDTALIPVQVGDRVRIQAAVGGKGQLSGAKKTSYVKDGKKVPKVVVYGNRLTNLTRQPAPAPVQTPAGARSATTPAHHPAMSETEAVEAYWRIFERHAAKLSRFIEAEDLDGFMRTAPAELLNSAHRAAAPVFGAILSGHVAPDTKRPADPAPKPATTQPRQDDPFEGLDEDGDIPF